MEYDYSIGKYDISQNMITPATNSRLTGVTAGAHTGDKPAANVSWFKAAKFVNWMSTSSGGNAAYKFYGSGNFQLWTPRDPGFSADRPKNTGDLAESRFP